MNRMKLFQNPQVHIFHDKTDNLGQFFAIIIKFKTKNIAILINLKYKKAFLKDF